MDFLDSIESREPSERKKGSSGDPALGVDGGEPQQRSSGEKSGSGKIEAARNILGSVRPEKKALKGLNIFGKKSKNKKNADKAEKSVKGLEMRALGNTAIADKKVKHGPMSPTPPSQFDAARAPAMDDVPADFDWSDSENEAQF